jgi:protease-4
MKRFLVRLLAVIGALVVIAAVVVAAAVLVFRARASRVPDKTVLELDLERALPERVPDNPLAQILNKDQPTLRDVVEGLEKAGDDPKVKALVATIGAAPLGTAQVQEIRDAVIAFRGKGKRAVAFSETFGEVGPGNGAYYLATAFDEIWLQPSGDIGLTGMVAEHPFLKQTLDKLDVEPQMDHRYEYKNAMNLFTEERFTAAHREATEKLIGSIFGQMVRGIAQGRKLSETEVRALVDRGPFLGPEAVGARLVDGLAYRDEVYEKVKKAAGEDSKLLFLARYVQKAGRPHQKGKVVALVHGLGNVTRGESDEDPFGGQGSMGSDTVTKALRAAMEDDDVKAIVFRVDSPGGSYVASDAIWREVVRARQKGKPVVITMGNVAASGGYFVSMPADKIVAQPGTITGSIGVLGGKFVTRDFWGKLGVTWDEAHTGANATMYSTLTRFTPAEWARFQAWLDRVYGDFTSKVAEGRKLPKEKVLEIAKGRVWTGEDAKALGLVDELGGFHTALRLAKQAAKIADGEDVQVRTYPRRRTPLEQIMGGGPRENSEAAALRQLARQVQALEPLLRRLRALSGEMPAPLEAPLPRLTQ